MIEEQKRTTHLTRDEAWALLTRYNKDTFHLHHAETVEQTMRWFARELGYGEEEDYWGIVGLLHDIDFERWPQEHCAKSQTLLKELGVEDSRFPLKTTSNDELVMVSGPPRYVHLVAEMIEKADKLREKRTFSEVETRLFPLTYTWADDVSFNANSNGSASGFSFAQRPPPIRQSRYGLTPSPSMIVFAGPSGLFVMIASL